MFPHGPMPPQPTCVGWNKQRDFPRWRAHPPFCSAPRIITESPWRCRKLAGGWWLVANPKHQLWSLGIIEPFLWLKNLENSKYWKPPPTGPTSSHSSPEKVLSSLGVRRTHFLRSSVHFWTHSWSAGAVRLKWHPLPASHLRLMMFSKS